MILVSHLTIVSLEKIPLQMLLPIGVACDLKRTYTF